MKNFLEKVRMGLKTVGKKVAQQFPTSAVIKVLSYVLTAAAAAALTTALLLPFMYTAVPAGATKLTQLEQLIRDRFIGEVDLTKLEDAAANAMIGATGDRWSYYIPASQMQAYEEQKNNAYVGIGITIQRLEDGSLKIINVTVGGSAESAGVQAGDVIVGVDGKSIAGMDLDAVKDMVRGEENTEVALTVRRGGQEQTISVTRKRIKTPVAIPKLLENNVGYIQIVNFNAGCASETIKAIEELMAQGANKLIFDVRYNGGGYASEMVDLLDYLLPKGEIFRTVDYTGKVQVEYSDAKHLDLPMTVLVNGSSYSAAEFFAAALREYEAATVIGEQTSGKGYFQVTFQLSDGSGVALSIGKYYTPQGNSLEKVGITPDVVVPVDEETAAAIYAGTLDPMEDPQILKAIELLIG